MRNVDLLDMIFGIKKISKEELNEISDFIKKHSYLNLELSTDLDYKKENLIDIFNCENKHYLLLKKY